MLNHLMLWQAIKIGGPVMYVLIGCSIVSITVILERIFYYYKRSRTTRERFMKQIREQLEKSDVKGASMVCHRTQTPFACVVTAGLSSPQAEEKEVSEALERAIVVETADLERRTAIVGTIGSTAVYIGLLGTVWGIMKTFKDMAQHGSGGINIVIGGISEALICTAAGLFVAIPAVVAYNYFVKRINSFVIDMELCASEVTGLLRAHKKAKAK
ncbi:MAG: MotA/TolQ/ExbB proton channel family protein [Candidatus Omnitrophota bacterium]|nr:MotA/TolQ/ExbB proton channel family protein [Candidatus Omnitrophota bacterium]